MKKICDLCRPLWQTPFSIVLLRNRYEQSEAMPWDPTEKKKELYHTGSRFLLLKDEAVLVGFAMFRFEADEDDLEEFIMYM